MLEEQRKEVAEQKEAQRMLNLYHSTRDEAQSATHTEMWAQSPFFADGHTRNPKVRIFSIVPDYASVVGDLTYLWLQEVRYFRYFFLYFRHVSYFSLIFCIFPLKRFFRIFSLVY